MTDPIDVSPKPPIPPRYIGDGVYARFDGYQIWLDADRDGMRHSIAVEPYTMNGLVDFARACWPKPPAPEGEPT